MPFRNKFFARFIPQKTNKSTPITTTIFFVTIILVNIILTGDFLLQKCYANESNTKNISNASANKIVPFVNDSTFVIAHINLAEIDLKVLRKSLTKFTNRITQLSGTDKQWKNRFLAETEKLFNTIFPVLDSVVIDLAVNAELQEVYLVGTLVNFDNNTGKNVDDDIDGDSKNTDGNLEPIFFLAVPHNIKNLSDKNIAARQKIEMIFRFISRQFKLCETHLHAKNDLLLYPLLQDNKNSNNNDEQNETSILQLSGELVDAQTQDVDNGETSQNNRLFDEDAFKNFVNTFSATKNQYLADAFNCCENDWGKIIFLFGKPVQTFLTQYADNNADHQQVTNVFRYILGQINYLSVGIDPVKLRLHAVAKARNAMSAKQVQNGLSGLMDWGLTVSNTSVALAITFMDLSDKILPVVSFAFEVIRGTANFAVPVCNKDNLTWNYEINPEKISTEFAATVAVIACAASISVEEYLEHLFDKWKEEIKPILKK
ncbi:MAG: hypothetical protein LBT09_15795 [Planctomycetaceae bacterium]|jgi:hypothetical protein|nr:hypothetical protein [Planctomycetaceae bacterium]